MKVGDGLEGAGTPTARRGGETLAEPGGGGGFALSAEGGGALSDTPADLGREEPGAGLYFDEGGERGGGVNGVEGCT